MSTCLIPMDTRRMSNPSRLAHKNDISSVTMVTGILCHLKALAKWPYKLMQVCKNRQCKEWPNRFAFRRASLAKSKNKFHTYRWFANEFEPTKSALIIGDSTTIKDFSDKTQVLHYLSKEARSVLMLCMPCNPRWPFLYHMKMADFECFLSIFSWNKLV